MRPAFKLVQPRHSSDDTVDCLKAMLKDAEAGEMLGVVASGMYKNRSYEFFACGEARRSPTFTIGVLIVFVFDLVLSLRGMK